MAPAHVHNSKASVKEGAAEAAKLGRAALGDAADVSSSAEISLFSH